MVMLKISQLVMLTLLLHAGSAVAVDFTGQVQQDGSSVYSNIPADCVEDGVLICLQYHPMNQLHFQRPQASAKPSPSAASTASSKSSSGQVRIKSQTAGNSAEAAGQAALNPQLGVLQQLVEMNKILDQHFTGQGSAQDRLRVQQQQNQVMQLLGTVEEAASEEMRPTIRQAIEIFQSGMLE